MEVPRTETAAVSDTTQKADDPAQTPAATSEVVVEPQPQPAEVGEAPKATETPPAAPEVKPDEAPPGAPETYELKRATDSGLDLGLDDFETNARELNLTNEGAQTILDTAVLMIQKATDEKLQGHRAEWTETAKNDKEFGGVAFETSLELANKAVKQFASPKLITLLDESGFSNHPESVRMFWKIGKAISEDVLLSGGPRGGVPEDIRDKDVQAKRMYPEKE